jgi:FkbM family methyltransferase
VHISDLSQVSTAENLHRHIVAVLNRDPAIERRPAAETPCAFADSSKVDASEHTKQPERLSVAELMRLFGPELIRNAFRTILRREPEFEEYVRYIWAADRLGSAKALIAELACVPEARQYPLPPDFSIDVSELLFMASREAFLGHAYRTILGRDPDPEGYRAALSTLRWLPRKRYLTALATSSEAQSRPIIFLWRGQPLQRLSLRERARLELATLVDSLLTGLYRRVFSIEAYLSRVADAQAAIQNDLASLRIEHASLKAAVHAARLEEERRRERQRGLVQARLDVQPSDSRVIARPVKAHVRTVTALIERNAANAVRLDKAMRDVASRAPAFSVSVGDRLLVSRVRGLVMAMPAEDVLLTSMLTMYGSIDAGLEAFFARVLRSGMTFIDVGAHIGIHTLRAAALVGDAGQVFSFEPAPRLFEILSTNVTLNGFTGRVRVGRKAISESAGVSRFILKQQSGHNTMYGSPEEGDSTIEVETAALDEQLSALPRIDFVKIDAEGAEPAILRGMGELLKRHSGLQGVIEFAPNLLRRAAVDPGEFACQLQERFSLRRIHDMTGELLPTCTAELLSIDSSNILLSRA